MPTFTQHALGTFCWPECATSDAAASKTFYSELLGWTWNEEPAGPGMTYYTAMRNGKGVAAMYELDDRMKQMGMPPHWASYVSVADTDEAVAKARSLGGELLMGPHDVMEHGRMAVLRDPLGATFCVWQAKKHHGIELAGEPGSLGWTQLNANDPAKAKQFYPALLGWTFQDIPDPVSGTYTMWQKSDGPAGGMMPMPAEAKGAPSHWLVYWAVADARAAHAKAGALGAKTFVPPTDIPGMGTFAVLADPAGVMFALVGFAMA